MNRKPITIKSHFGKRITISENADGVHLACSADESGEGGHLRIYKRADLHKALGIDELGCGCDDADDNLKAAIARAEAAEAKLAKVREWIDGDEQFDALDAILNPFTLPTEAGAEFEADHDGRTFLFEVANFPSDGTVLYVLNDEPAVLTAAEVMRDFTNHRLIGATK